MSRRRGPITVVMNYCTSTPSKHCYKASAIGEGSAKRYLPRIDAVGDEAPRTIEVTVPNAVR